MAERNSDESSTVSTNTVYVGVACGISAGLFLLGTFLYHCCVLKKYVRRNAQSRLDNFTILYVDNTGKGVGEASKENVL